MTTQQAISIAQSLLQHEATALAGRGDTTAAQQYVDAAERLANLRPPTTSALVAEVVLADAR